MRTTTTCTGCGAEIPESPLNHPDYGPAQCVSCRYDNPPEAKRAESEFDVATANTAAPDQEPTDDKPDDPMREYYAAKLRVWLDWLDRGPVETVGKRVKMIRYLNNETDERTDAEFSAELKISRARLSQIRREFIADFGVYGNCRNRIRLTCQPKR